MKNINFALITSNSLMDKIPSWSSYQNVDEDQYIDLINYSKELVQEDSNHKITFLVIAQGVDSTEEEEEKMREEIEQEREKINLEKQRRNNLRDKSKSILNSIYGI